jgi:hypothetical protein
MTIYGTPGGTPLNTTPFQGTQPGNAVGATFPGLPQQVGLFPPNSNNLGGGSVMDALSKAVLPANAFLTNTLLGALPRTTLESMGKGVTVGTATNPGGGGFDTMNISANGGSGPGPVNASLSPNSGISDQMATTMPAASLSMQNPQGYQG